METISVFTDGSSTVKKINNIRFGGIGVFFGRDDVDNISRGYKSKKVSNQRMELLACIEAIKIIKKNKSKKCKIKIYTDSMYTINCATKWASNWEMNGWIKSDGKKICNLDLIKRLYNLTNRNTVEYHHVRGHQKEPLNKESNSWYFWNGNDNADILARTAMESLKKSYLNAKI